MHIFTLKIILYKNSNISITIIFTHKPHFHDFFGLKLLNVQLKLIQNIYRIINQLILHPLPLLLPFFLLKKHKLQFLSISVQIKKSLPTPNNPFSTHKNSLFSFNNLDPIQQHHHVNPNSLRIIERIIDSLNNLLIHLIKNFLIKNQKSDFLKNLFFKSMLFFSESLKMLFFFLFLSTLS